MSTKRRLVTVIVIWALSQLIFTILSGYWEWNKIADQFAEDQQRITQVITTRFGQHDVIAAGLISAARLPKEVASQAFQEIAADTLKSFPRVTQVEIYRYDGAASPVPPALEFSMPNPVTQKTPLSVLSKIFQQQPMEVKAHAGAALLNQYLRGMVFQKGSDRFALVLTIDAVKLFEPLKFPQGTFLELNLDDIPIITVGDPHSDDDQGLFGLLKPQMNDVLVMNYLNWRTLKIYVHHHINLLSLYTLADDFVFLVISTLLFGAIYYGWQQTALLKVSREAAEKATRRAELMERENRIEHASRVNSIGELASGIIHELNQPLSAVLSQSHASLKVLKDLRIDNQLLDKALNGNLREATRAGQILGRIRDYIVKKEMAYEALDLNAVISGTVEILEAELSKQGVQLDIQYSAQPLMSQVSGIEFEQVIHNLVRNAIDALVLEGDGQKRITITTDSIGAENVIRVADNGPGLSADVQSQIFQPFFSTKTSGMGLGLSLCAKLLERVGGTISAINQNGAVFTIRLPANS